MNFSTDRDLLALEPNVFTDVPLVSQQRVGVNDGVVSGTTLTSVTADFEAAGVDAGAVVLIGGVAHEVVGRVDAGTLTVSLPRARADGPAIVTSGGTGLEVSARTFELQAALVHDLLLEALGIDTDDARAMVTEAMIVSKRVMRQVEAVGALERIYAGAVSVSGDRGMLWEKASFYHERFRRAFDRARILLDLDGDGVADTQRQLGVMRMSRV